MKKRILLSHGSGGLLTQELLQQVIIPRLGNSFLRKLPDSAVLEVEKSRLAFTTDSFVVHPLFFRGGDIGTLAVSGTVNDLVVTGARPLYLSLGLIIEEGLECMILERIIDSIASTARTSGVKVVTGDIKVVEKGACDKIFINTAGIGSVVQELRIEHIQVGDDIIISGRIAEHGLSVFNQRKDIDFGLGIRSDCASLDDLLIPLLRQNNTVRFMRDPTRGGIATTLHEIAYMRRLGVMIEEKHIPLSCVVKAACELLGIDPLYVANEGKALIITHPRKTKRILHLLKKHPLGRHASIIGKITAGPPAMAILKTHLGLERILGPLVYEALPRIC